MSEAPYTNGQTARVAEPAAGRPHGRDLAPSFRLYVDDVGNPGLKRLDIEDNRYLSLTGVAIQLRDVATVIGPELERIKYDHFGSHPDEPVVLHRKELVNKVGPFLCLREPARETAFNTVFLDALARWPVTVFTATLDKLAHQEAGFDTDPYHDTLAALSCRYVQWLTTREAMGDVLSESRNGSEDRRLKDAFEDFCRTGSSGVSADQLRARLSSHQLKIRSKQANLPGLQLADLLAYPFYRSALEARRGGAYEQVFGAALVQRIAASKHADGDQPPHLRCVWLPPA